VLYEHRKQPVLPRKRFVRRLMRHGVYALLLLTVSLAIGMGGYHWIAGFDWVDSLLNASMLLGGMGPVGDLPNDAAKLFASAYALYSGIAFLVLAGLMLAPVFHRILHRFHWEADRQGGQS
jgi:hypothetical protein